MILRLQFVSGTVMRYADALALSVTTLTRGVVSSALATEAVALLGGALLV